MTKKSDWDISLIARGIAEVLGTILGNLLRDAAKMISAFAIGTGASALVCWYYEIPLVLSLLGGLVVLGATLAFVSNSIFD